MTPQDRRPEPDLPAPAWYPDAQGTLRWWDGRQWTPHVTQPAPPDRSWAVVAHLSIFAIPLIGALAIRLMSASRDPFTRHHATEALNAQLLLGIVYNAALIPAFLITAAQAPAHPHDVPVLLLIAVPFGMAMFLTTMALSIRGAVQAHRGLWWRYPVNLRLVRGAQRP